MTNSISFRDITRNPSLMAGLFLIVIYCLIGLGLYYNILSKMVAQWNSQDYTHCYFIPVIIAYLLFEKRKALVELPVSYPWLGIIPLLLGIFLYGLGELGGEFYTLYISFTFVVIGVAMIHMGYARIRSLFFVLVLMITMFPFPAFVYNNLSVNLQLISSKLGTGLVQLIGIPAYREGNVIDLGVTRLQVVDACNGIRYLLPLMVLGLIIAYFIKGSFWKKVFIVLSTVPLAILLNGTRIAIAAVSAIHLKPEVSEGILHDFSGFVFFMVSLGLLLGEVVVLGKLGRRFTGTEPERSPNVSGSPEAVLNEPLPAEGPKGRRFPWQPQSIVVIVLLTGTLILGNGIDFREATPIKKALAIFPLDVGPWHGTRVFLEQDMVNSLHLSDYTMVNYVDSEGKVINLYIAYYQSQRKGESIHSPETCLPGNGWIFTNAGLTGFEVPGIGEKLEVNRALIEKLSDKQVAYYWFPLRGRILHSLWQIKFFNFWDAISIQRTDGALVRLITPLSPYEDAQQGDKRLQEFTRKIFPNLGDFLPGRQP